MGAGNCGRMRARRGLEERLAYSFIRPAPPLALLLHTRLLALGPASSSSQRRLLRRRALCLFFSATVSELGPPSQLSELRATRDRVVPFPTSARQQRRV